MLNKEASEILLSIGIISINRYDLEANRRDTLSYAVKHWNDDINPTLDDIKIQASSEFINEVKRVKQARLIDDFSFLDIA